MNEKALSELIQAMRYLPVEFSEIMSSEKCFEVYSLRYENFSEIVKDVATVNIVIGFIGKTKYLQIWDIDGNTLLEFRRVDDAYKHIKR